MNLTETPHLSRCDKHVDRRHKGRKSRHTADLRLIMQEVAITRQGQPKHLLPGMHPSLRGSRMLPGKTLLVRGLQAKTLLRNGPRIKMLLGKGLRDNGQRVRDRDRQLKRNLQRAEPMQGRAVIIIPRQDLQGIRHLPASRGHGFLRRIVGIADCLIPGRNAVPCLRDALPL